MRLLPRSLFHQNLLLIVVLILLGQLTSGVVFIFAVQQPRVVKLARMVAQQVVAVQMTATELGDEQRARFLAAMQVGDEFRLLPAAALPLDSTDFSGFDEPEAMVVRMFLRELRATLAERAQVVRWQATDRSIWVGLLLGDEPYWLTLRGGQLLPAAPWLFIGISGIATGLALLGAVGISRRINRPLARLVDAARALGRGERPPHLDERGPSEIATVAASFNQLADDLETLDRERAVMLAGVSHDLRTPLAKLRLALDISENRLEPDLFAQMERSIEDIDRLLDQFMAFARIGSDEAVETVDASALVRSVVAGFDQRGERIAIEPAPAVWLPLRPLACRRLLANLLDNAIKYGEGSISVRSRLADGQWLLEVVDGGPGIAAEEVERLLQPFVRASDARAGLPGAGLGLAIVRRIVELHGGRLTLGARADGQRGLAVTVSLPLIT